MSVVVYNIGYDTKKIKKRKNMVTVWLLAAILKGKKNFTRHRLPKKEQYFKAAIVKL